MLLYIYIYNHVAPWVVFGIVVWCVRRTATSVSWSHFMASPEVE